MNYLAHLFLSPPNDDIRLGNLMGDFVKGNRFSYLPDDIVKGIYLHRRIDKFTDNHQAVKSLKNTLSPDRKRFHGIITDITFDHFLARHWSHYSNDSLASFIKSNYQILSKNQAYMPERMQLMVQKMIEHDWLSQYQHVDAVSAAINGVSRRIRFENKLVGAGTEVVDNYHAYEQAFHEFFPELFTFVQSQLAE